jgi:ABC-type Fe3+-hydroxamate transport system substrate-binding protein
VLAQATAGAGCREGASPSGRGAERREPGSHEIPRRIVSLAPSATEILFAIGAGPQVVGVDAYSDFPPPARTRPRLGALLDPDLEGMLRLAPDLAVLLPSQAETATALEEAGVRTLTIPHETLADVESAIRLLGLRTGHQREARALADSLERTLERAKSETSGRAPLRVLFVVAREEGQLASVTVAGPATYLDELIRTAAAVNVLPPVGTRYPQVSAETILRLGPDVILEWAPVAATATAVETAASDGRRVREWRRLFAGAGGRAPEVHVLHDDLWLRPGPRVVQALQRLRALLAPGR